MRNYILFLHQLFEQQRALARRARERRRRRRRTLIAGTAGGILLLSGIITLLLPKSVTGEATPPESASTGSTQASPR